MQLFPRLILPKSIDCLGGPGCITILKFYQNKLYNETEKIKWMVQKQDS